MPKALDNWYLKVLFLTLVISAATILVTKYSPAIPISSTVTQKDSFFMVSGEGKVTVVPDTGIVNLGVTVPGKTVKEVQTEANQKINGIVSKLKSMQIADKDIETNNYSINPQYDYSQSNNNQITGYTITANISVTVRKLDQVNEVIDSATALGANTLGGIQFTVGDDRRKELVKEARVKAIADAKDKAANLSQTAGLSLGRIINIQESSSDLPRPVMMQLNKAVGLGGAADAATSVQPGSTDITSSITLSYETR
jgi:uncharacterized protein